MIVFVRALVRDEGSVQSYRALDVLRLCEHIADRDLLDLGSIRNLCLVPDYIKFARKHRDDQRA